jgi:molybdate transport repressor ModE-like protein
MQSQDCGRPWQICELPLFDWNDLRHFLAVGRTGSMSAASKTLGVNQSTVQRRLAALEKSIGHTLVERHHDGYRLTRHGELLLAEAKQVEDAVSSLQRRITSLDEPATGRVRLSTLVTLGQRIIKSGFLERFHDRCPGITIEMEMGQRIADLGRGEADIAIRGGTTGSNALVGMKIADLPWAIYASRAFVQRHGKPATAADLPRFPLIELVDELTNIPAARWLKDLAPSATIAARCGNIPSAVLAVKAGAGLAALPFVHASAEEDLACVLGPQKEHAYPIYLLVHKDMRRVPRVAAAFDFCRRELKSVLLTGQLR